METVDIRKNAAAVAVGERPAFTVAEYEDEMFKRADELALRHSITPEQALSKGLSSDPELMDLAHASEVARYGDYAAEVRKHHRPEVA